MLLSPNQGHRIRVTFHWGQRQNWPLAKAGRMVRPLGWEVKSHISLLTLPWPSPWGPAFFEPGSPQLGLKGDRLLEPFKSQTQAVFGSSSSIFLFERIFPHRKN